ncbi:hypothetical protein HDA40_000243 [Hamadaea flava]|uniref:SMI1/KNR4 family protein n=1 Tax=Hamadaea flava TaxID=1742688 RepID=A0ABV8LRU5_9ACTN|nr:hypothetical protein [Hamadaea flava]MCP2321736.1 hypothetical protein [Hamadaea flava]
MTIDELVAAFAALPGARVGAGPRHPVRPDATLTPRLTAFFALYPPLANDAGYAELLWKYGGLARSDESEDQLFDVFGFGADVVDLDQDLYGPGVDEQGFFIVAEAVVHADTADGPDTYEYDFALSVAGDREPGVYVFTSTLTARAPEWTRYADDFTAFLADAVERGTVWPRPAL